MQAVHSHFGSVSTAKGEPPICARRHIGPKRHRLEFICYTRSGAVARHFAASVQTGMVGVNLGVPAPVALFPFTGWKGSFYGDTPTLGKDGVRFYTETKVITSRWTE